MRGSWNVKIWRGWELGVITSKRFDLVEAGILGQKGLEIEGECAFLHFKSELAIHGVRLDERGKVGTGKWE